jgi:hypothetical protein
MRLLEHRDGNYVAIHGSGNAIVVFLVRNPGWDIGASDNPVLLADVSVIVIESCSFHAPFMALPARAFFCEAALRVIGVGRLRVKNCKALGTLSFLADSSRRVVGADSPA